MFLIDYKEWGWGYCVESHQTVTLKTPFLFPRIENSVNRSAFSFFITSLHLAEGERKRRAAQTDH